MESPTSFRGNCVDKTLKHHRDEAKHEKKNASLWELSRKIRQKTIKRWLPFLKILKKYSRQKIGNPGLKSSVHLDGFNFLCNRYPIELTLESWTMKEEKIFPQLGTGACYFFFRRILPGHTFTSPSGDVVRRCFPFFVRLCKSFLLLNSPKTVCGNLKLEVFCFFCGNF